MSRVGHWSDRYPGTLSQFSEIRLQKKPVNPTVNRLSQLRMSNWYNYIFR
ncbi:hypothetical protein WKK05_30905 [Nostoc sp. UHCC 0302]